MAVGLNSEKPAGFTRHIFAKFARFILKRTIITILLVSGLTAMTWAQGWGRVQDSRNNPPRPAAETVTVSGSLVVSHGMPALASGDVTYIITGISRLIGFVDGLKEGAQVSIEGSAFGNNSDAKLKYLRPVKLTLGGKTYDLAPLVSQNFMNRMPQPLHNFRNQIPPQPRFQAPPPPNNNRQPNHPLPPSPQGPRQRQRSL